MDYKDVKSVHIFAWPFKVRKASEKVLDNITENWKRNSLSYKKDVTDNISNLRKLYSLNQYLSRSARDIFIEEKKASDCKVYDLVIPKDLRYIVKKDDSEYNLEIEEVFLHIYSDIKVGILFLKIVNKKYGDISDIKKINDYGRRVFLPFIPSHNNGYIICADKLSIESERENISIVTDFRSMINDFNNGSLDGFGKSADFLYRLLFNDLKGERTDIPYSEIDEITDDRMFTQALIINKDFSEKIKSNCENEDYLNELYSLIYIDAKAPTCQNRNMRNKLLNTSVYPRWKNYGTIHGATNYSLLCITGEGDLSDTVYNPFLEQYTYIYSLVILQKIGIGKFSDEAGGVSHGVERDGVLNKNEIKNLLRLQERYIAFINKYLILEVSNQEQGIDIYRLLQRQMLIDDEKVILDEQLESLYEAANVSNGSRFEIKGIYIAIVAIIIDVIINIFVTCCT